MMLAVPDRVTSGLRILHTRSVASQSPKGEGFTDPKGGTLNPALILHILPQGPRDYTLYIYTIDYYLIRSYLRKFREDQSVHIIPVEMEARMASREVAVKR